MAIKTNISYCDGTVNPVPTCSGCELFHVDLSKNHCFAHRMSRRWGSRANKGWPESFTKYQFFPGRIEKACGWSDLTGTKRPEKPHLDGYPRIIFLNDMGDGFSPIAPLDWSAPYIDMMAESPHIWLWLTKWPHRMFNFFADLGYVPDNFWLGTTITSQETMWRMRQLMGLRDMAKVLWVSAEPLLEEIDLETWLSPDISHSSHGILADDSLLDWIAAGGMSGSNALPTHPDAFRSLRNQCNDAGVPFYYKQHGKWIHQSQIEPICSHLKAKYHKITKWPDGSVSWPVGTKVAGHLLDGEEWTEMPG